VRHLVSVDYLYHVSTCYGLPWQAIIFCSCGFYLHYLFSAPILSGRRLHVYHTSTHDVALVQI